MNLLYISDCIPHDGIRHAGGKTVNYYVTSLLENKNFNIKVVGITNEEEWKTLKKTPSIDYRPVISKGSLIKNLIRCATDCFGICTFRKRYDQSYYKVYHILHSLKALQKEKYAPDVIILEWTKMVLMAQSVQSLFPDARLIASEHDVSFQGAERRYFQAKGLKRKVLKRKYERLKKRELEALKLCSIVMPQSEKDKKLLVQNSVPEQKIFVLTPYYHDMSYIKRENLNHDILFWGAMYREENFQAALWFIEQVMPLLKDTDVRFIIAGNRPPQELRDRASDRVLVTGFVEDESELFSHSMCFVSPLLLGAGIKVKVLEALSAGIPVLTNQIGIEGIPAVDGVSYYHCDTAEQYAEKIISLIDNRKEQDRIAEEARKFMSDTFNLDKAAGNYKKMLFGMQRTEKTDIQ